MLPLKRSPKGKWEGKGEVDFLNMTISRAIDYGRWTDEGTPQRGTNMTDEADTSAQQKCLNRKIYNTSWLRAASHPLAG